MKKRARNLQKILSLKKSWNKVSSLLQKVMWKRLWHHLNSQKNENPQDANTKKYVEQLQQVNRVHDLIEEKEYEQAVKTANQTMEKYTLFSPVQKE